MLLVVIIIYNVIALGNSVASSAGMEQTLSANVAFTMFSGEVWHFTLGDLLIVLGLGTLFVEIAKSTRTTQTEVINHALSMLVFTGALIEFIVLKGFATSTFFLLVIMCLFDVIAGFTISIVAAKRDLGMTNGVIGTN